MTVNYGTGTPALAAAWVKQATTTAGQGVTEWEIGNESYGCWEYNDWLTRRLRTIRATWRTIARPAR